MMAMWNSLFKERNWKHSEYVLASQRLLLKLRCVKITQQAMIDPYQNSIKTLIIVKDQGNLY
jgi:hypothetical protein